MHARAALPYTERLLAAAAGPCVAIASAGTVNAGDSDDFSGLARLKERYGLWLHVDAAFGGFASLSPALRPLLQGWDCADSICIDLHKWLNVPYASAVAFTRHRDLPVDVFANVSAYLGRSSQDPEPIHLARKTRIAGARCRRVLAAGIRCRGLLRNRGA